MTTQNPYDLPAPLHLPRALTLAADARLSRTDYTDDQSWEFSVGAQDSPALALQTRYGGRVGLASLVPMWLLDGRTIYQAMTYTRPPQMTAFAPGYVRAEAGLAPNLALTADVWVMESHAVGARYTVVNTGAQDALLRLDLFGHVGMGGRALRLAVLTLDDGRSALALGDFAGLRPIVLMQDGGAQITPNGKASPKLSQAVSIPAGGVIMLRWVHAGLRDLRDSLALAESWLAEDWDAHFRAVNLAAEAIPTVRTGSPELDSVIALSYHTLVQAVLRPTGALPHATFVTARQPQHGYSANGDGSDHERAWSGQPAQLAYPVALALAQIDPALAQGIVLNALAVQTPEGGIDARPGMAGQRQGFASPPLLAALTWEVYQISGDEAFLRAALPGLVRFFNYWLARGAGGLPAWDDERQTGYLYFPTFGRGSQWAQNADIRHVVGPDMAAYLLAEAGSLAQIACALGDDGLAATVTAQQDALRGWLEALWDGERERYAYHDRALRAVSRPVMLLTDARADEDHFIAQKLPTPARLIVRVTGGTGKTPRLTLLLDGTDADGSPVSEMASPPAFGWYRGYGVYTSQHVYAALDRVRVEGLSRVYRLEVTTLDTTRTDLNTLLPLWGANLPQPRAEALVKLATGPFWRPNGVSMTPHDDPDFDPSNQRGSGGVWPLWAGLVGLGLWRHRRYAEAVTLLHRLLTAQAAALLADGHFHEFYHSDEPQGLGEAGSLSGIAPLHLLMRTLGVLITSSSSAWVGGVFAWGAPVTVQQHGVTVTRSSTGTQVAFPSGYVADIEADAEWQRVDDPAPLATGTLSTPAAPPRPAAEQPSAGRVVIRVELE